MRRWRGVLTLIVVVIIPQIGVAQTLQYHIIDVGAGLCTVGIFPNDIEPEDPFYFMYDAGYGCTNEVESLIPEHEVIDLMVLSHNDADHIATADNILDLYEVRRIIWTGQVRDTNTWEDLVVEIDREENADVINLENNRPENGRTYVFGETFVTFVSGHHVPPAEWGFSPSDHSEYNNAGSIVIRIQYKEKRILLTGDMIGRHENSTEPEDHIIAAELEVLQNRTYTPINSDVLIASHHGGNDASSTPFIHAVSPEYVIFSAGSRDTYGHPNRNVAQRFLDSGVLEENIFRTDLRDDEDHPDHWENDTTVENNNDPSGDNDITIRIHSDSRVAVFYNDL